MDAKSRPVASVIAARLASTCAGSSCCVCHHSFCGFCGAAKAVGLGPAAHAMVVLLRPRHLRLAARLRFHRIHGCHDLLVFLRVRHAVAIDARGWVKGKHALRLQLWSSLAERAKYELYLDARLRRGTAAIAALLEEPRVLLPSALSLSGSITTAWGSVRLVGQGAGACVVAALRVPEIAAFGRQAIQAHLLVSYTASPMSRFVTFFGRGQTPGHFIRQRIKLNSSIALLPRQQQPTISELRCVGCIGLHRASPRLGVGAYDAATTSARARADSKQNAVDA